MYGTFCKRFLLYICLGISVVFVSLFVTRFNVSCYIVYIYLVTTGRPELYPVVVLFEIKK